MSSINLEFAVVTMNPATQKWEIQDDEGNAHDTDFDSKSVADATLTLLKAGASVPVMVQSGAVKAVESIAADTPKKGRNVRFMATEETVIKASQPGYKRAARVRQIADSVFDAGMQDDIQRIVYDTLMHEGDTVAKGLCYKYVSDYLKRRQKV